MKTIKDIDVKDKTILMRVDYNVPLTSAPAVSEDASATSNAPEVASDLRIRASLPTLEYLRENGAKKIVLISHLGRPEGIDPSFSLKPVAKVLENLIGNVTFLNEISGEKVETAVKNAKSGEIILLENLRFYEGEKKNDPDFIKQVVDSTKPDFYIQDAFAVLHRAHASTDAIKQFLPIYAGLLVENEVENLKKTLKNPEKPFLFIIGGSKVEDKQPLIDHFLPKVDKILVGGKIAADGYKPAVSKTAIVEPTANAPAISEKIYVAEDFDEDGEGTKLDIGPVSTANFASAITDAKTIIWNGVLGKVEDPAYATASTIVAELLGEATDKTTIICGGDTTGFVENLMASHASLHYDLISTGGGATLEYLCGKPMPGLSAISA